MTDDDRNIDVLAIFHYVVGGMTALFSCLFLLHVAMGIAMLCGAFDGKDAPPKILAWFFIVIPSIFILAGWMLAGFIIVAGRKLKRRVDRTFCLVIAGIECMLMPFGTVLGVFTIMVLMKDSAKLIFTDRHTVDGLPKTSM